MEASSFSQTLDATYARLRQALHETPRDYAWRTEQLLALRRMFEENDSAISEAMWKDLRKSKFECQATEQGVVVSEINEALKNLKKWLRPRRVATPLYNQIGKSYIVHEPYGLTLIIGAWNYPIQLTLAPLVGAIAGGNAAIIKPSEISAHTSHLIAELLPKYLSASAFAVIEGGADETDLILDKQFDLIFVTGSGPVGKIVMQKAAAHLTPVTLELGGKSPAIVTADADLKVSARRIAWGKFMNAGQTCVAPDYVIVHPDVREKFVSELKNSLHEFYGENVQSHPDYCRIINTRNFDRLMKLMRDTPILHGGRNDRDSLFIEPTILGANLNSPAMSEEIFGPLLPILEIGDTTSIIDFIHSKPKPLAFYLFTKDSKQVERFAAETSSGGFCVNDVVIHLPEPSLPFGGVGASGMGNYHGKFSFKTFTHAKGLLIKKTFPDLAFRYPPYDTRKAKWLKWLFR